MKRNLLVALWTALGLGLVGCTDEPSALDGTETGACIEGDCLGQLECYSGLCVDPQWMPPASTSGGETDSASSQGSISGSGGEETSSGDVELAPQVSVLFVIDNSGSMGEEQSNLAASIPYATTRGGSVPSARDSSTASAGLHAWVEQRSAVAGRGAAPTSKR